MVCEHLKQLDRELSNAGIEVIYRDEQPWSKNCRAWTRYACYLDLDSIRERLGLDACVENHLHKDHWTGEERGFYCREHQDALIGDYAPKAGRPVIT